LGQQNGFAHPIVLMLLPTSFVFFIGFIVVELRVDQPMINLDLFQNPLLCVNLLTGFITFVALGGIFILIPFYLKVILGFKPIIIGLLMSVIPIMMGIFSPISGALSDHFGSRPMTLLGLIVLFFGYITASTLNAQTDGLGFMIRILGIGIGTGIFLSPNNSAIMGAGPKNQLGIVSGLMAISRTLGQTAGISIIGTLWVIRIRSLTGNWELNDVTKAPVSAQIQALQFIFIVVATMIFIGFCFSISGYILERKMKYNFKQITSY